MFCCCCCFRPPKVGEVIPKILDVERILQDYVWSQYIETCHRCLKRFLKRSDYDVHVPMNYFHFETVRQKLTERSLPGEGSAGRLINEQLKRQRDDDNVHLNAGACQGSVELKTVYTNKTPQEQTYQFRLERSRASTLTYNIQTGFSIGGKTRFDLKLPCTSVGGEVDMRYTITEAEGSSIAETATFATSSDIKVEKHSECVAKVVMDEVSVDYDFSVKTLMTLSSEGCPATIRRKKDGKLFYNYGMNSIDDIFKRYESSYLKIDPDLEKLFKGKKCEGKGISQNGEEHNANADVGDPTKGNNQQIAMARTKKANRGGIRVLFTTRGVIQGVRLSDQKIDLESTSLPKTNDLE